jgi:SAM-dependent methyltransferase
MDPRKSYNPKSFWDAKAQRAGMDFESAVCLDDPISNKIIDRIQKRMIRLAFRHILQRTALAGRKLLDYGCGTGRWVDFFQNYGLEYTGVDLSPEMIRIASGRYPNHKFSIVGSEGMEFQPWSLDMICTIAVIHHNRYPEQESILQQMGGLIKNQGFFVLFESIGKRTDIQDSESIVEFPRPVPDWVNTLNSLGFELIWSKNTRYFSTRTIMNKLAGENRFPSLTNKVGIHLDPYLGDYLPTHLHNRGAMVFQKVVEHG